MVILPDPFINTIMAIHKEKGLKWLNEFESLITYCENKYKLEVQEPYALSYNFVAPARCWDGTMKVLKLVVPGNNELKNEITALQLFNGNGMVRLLEFNLEKGIILLDHLSSGRQLATIEDDETSTILATEVMKQLWVPINSEVPLPSIVERKEQLYKIRNTHQEGIGPLTVPMLVEAEHLMAELMSTMKGSYLLHGDLHHYNILLNGEAWMAIDPKGLIGEREYDVTQFLLNKLPKKGKISFLNQRVNILEDKLQLSKPRIFGWGFCHSILSLYWNIEDFGHWEVEQLEMVNIFKELYHENKAFLKH